MYTCTNTAHMYYGIHQMNWYKYKDRRKVMLLHYIQFYYWLQAK